MNFNESNYTAEQLAAAKALLDSLAPKPRVWWGGLDNGGDIMNSTISDSREGAERAIRRQEFYHPHTLVRIEEVLP